MHELHPGRLLIAALLSGFAPSPAFAQAVDTTGLASGPWATMSMRYERTFLKVDVMFLTIRFGPETSMRLEALVQDGAADDSVADAGLSAENALVLARFLRDVSIDQFLEGVRENLAHVEEAGLIDEAERLRIEEDVESQYGAIAERGILEGDAQWYRVRGDTVDVVLEGRDGGVVVRDHVVGRERRLAVMGGYLVAGSEFRAKLLASLGRSPVGGMTPPT